jgi:hypothetical protein
MARLTQTSPDNTRTCRFLSGDAPPGQTRTYAFRHVQLSGVRAVEPPGNEAMLSRNFHSPAWQSREDIYGSPTLIIRQVTLIIDLVTGDGWWRIFSFEALTHPCEGRPDDGKKLSLPVDCHSLTALSEWVETACTDLFISNSLGGCWRGAEA